MGMDRLGDWFSDAPKWFLGVLALVILGALGLAFGSAFGTSDEATRVPSDSFPYGESVCEDDIGDAGVAVGPITNVILDARLDIVSTTLTLDSDRLVARWEMDRPLRSIPLDLALVTLTLTADQEPMGEPGLKLSLTNVDASVGPSPWVGRAETRDQTLADPEVTIDGAVATLTLERTPSEPATPNTWAPAPFFEDLSLPQRFGWRSWLDVTGVGRTPPADNSLWMDSCPGEQEVGGTVPFEPGPVTPSGSEPESASEDTEPDTTTTEIPPPDTTPVVDSPASSPEEVAMTLLSAWYNGDEVAMNELARSMVVFALQNREYDIAGNIAVECEPVSSDEFDQLCRQSGVDFDTVLRMQVDDGEFIAVDVSFE
jgi:hypothetical protein